MTLKTRGPIGAKTVVGQPATFSVKLSTAQMVQRGFDTEGVGAKPKTTALKIQCAMIIAGVAYSFEQPVTLKVSTTGNSAQISGRSSF